MSVRPSTASAIGRWASRRARKPGKLSLADVNGIQPRTDLVHGPVGSPHGGRISTHLQHPDVEDVTRLIGKADAFLAGTDPAKLRDDAWEQRRVVSARRVQSVRRVAARRS